MEFRQKWVWILGAAALLYAFYYPLYYVGILNDDAIYILCAKSLWQGRYAALFIPGQPPYAQYPPGFSLFLAPWVALLEPHWNLLKLLSLGLNLFNGLLVWHLLASWLSPKPRLVALALFSFNQATAISSGQVMSEPLLMSITLMSFLMLRRILQRKNENEGWILGLLLGCAPEIRTIGWVLIPAALTGLLYAKQTRAAARALGVALLIGGLFPLRNFWLTHHLTSYEVKSFLGYTSQWTSWLANANRVINMIFVDLFLSLKLPYTALGFSINAALTTLVLYVGGTPLTSWRSTPLWKRALYLSAILFVFLWGAIHSFWPAVGRRFALPLLPFLCAFFVAGCARHKRGLTLAYLLTGYSLLQAARLPWIKTFEQPKLAQDIFPQETFQWARNRLSPQSVLLNPKGTEVYLYTGHYCYPCIFTQDAKNFRSEVLKIGITHILVRALNYQTLGENTDRAWQLNQEWTTSWPQAFKPVYQNQDEQTAIYEVVPDPAFIRAHNLL